MVAGELGFLFLRHWLCGHFLRLQILTFCRHENNDRSGWFWRSALIIGLCMVDILWEAGMSLALDPKPS